MKISLSMLSQELQYEILAKTLEDVDTKPTAGMRLEAEKGLAWRKEFGRGGQEEGVARARDIKNGRNFKRFSISASVIYQHNNGSSSDYSFLEFSGWSSSFGNRSF